jgi:cellulose synthase/poly-beta-1,6-N-acetylglucosamine synthase-like glycosyltransferase
LGEEFIYARRESNSGKASNINYAVREFAHMLGDITVVNDSDTTPHKTCIETLAKNFTSDDVAAVTPYGYTTPPENALARALHHGFSWNNRIFKFRKRAQGYRGGISVVCGACTAYRTEVLKRLPVPERTKTEDTDYTWVLQENSCKVVYDGDALAYSRDLAKASSLCRQWFRWYSGVLQSVYVHGRQLPRARSMFWTTVLPSIMESVPYSFGIMTLPFIAALNLAMPQANIPFFHMGYVKGFLLADFLFTTIPTAIISPKYLLRLPQIYLYKYVASALTVFAYSKTTLERLMRQQHKWSSVWSRSYASKAPQYRADHKRIYESESR